jgi:anti-anti-sigma factor
MSDATPSIRTVTTESLTAEGAAEGDLVKVRLRGSAELGSKPTLDGFLADVFAASPGHREVVVDMTELEYMNSSSLKSLLSWIVRVRDLPEPREYKIRLLSNPELHWQQRSLHSLVSMCGEVIEVEERSEQGS